MSYLQATHKIDELVANSYFGFNKMLTVWKLRNFTITVSEKIFREIKTIVTSLKLNENVVLTKVLPNKCEKEFFRDFHHFVAKNPSKQYFHKKNFIIIDLTKIFCMAVNYSFFHNTVTCSDMCRSLFSTKFMKLSFSPSLTSRKIIKLPKYICISNCHITHILIAVFLRFK